MLWLHSSPGYFILCFEWVYQHMRMASLDEEERSEEAGKNDTQVILHSAPLLDQGTQEHYVCMYVYIHVVHWIKKDSMAAGEINQNGVFTTWTCPVYISPVLWICPKAPTHTFHSTPDPTLK